MTRVKLDWKPHLALRGHRKARYKGFSVINGPLVAIDAKYEVMTPDGDILRFQTEEGVLRFLIDEETTSW